MRDTYIAAARTGKMSMSARMFTMRIGQPDTGLDLMCCIPVEDDFAGEERTEFAESPLYVSITAGLMRGSELRSLP